MRRWAEIYLLMRDRTREVASRRCPERAPLSTKGSTTDRVPGVKNVDIGSFDLNLNSTLKRFNGV